MTIRNGKDSAVGGRLPQVTGALRGLMQPMTVETLVKTVINFQVVETATTFDFMGVVQPFTDRQLLLRPEGERAWTWLTLHADTSLQLSLDDVVTFKGKQSRVMKLKDWSDYGYVEYEIVQDYVGAGP